MPTWYLHGFWGFKFHSSCLCGKRLIHRASLQPLHGIFFLNNRSLFLFFSKKALNSGCKVFIPLWLRGRKSLIAPLESGLASVISCAQENSTNEALCCLSTQNNLCIFNQAPLGLSLWGQPPAMEDSLAAWRLPCQRSYRELLWAAATPLPGTRWGSLDQPA